MPLPIRRLTLCSLLALSAAGAARAAGDVQITTPQPGVVVAPGATVGVPLHFQNTAADASDPTPIRVAHTDDWTLAVTGAPGCGAIQSSPELGVYFPIPSLPAGGTLDCTLSLTRPASSIDDIQVEVWTELGFNEALVAAGTLADIALRSERVSYTVDPDGTAHGVFRVIAKNVGTTPVDPFNAATCTYERTFNNAIAGGCTPTTSACARGQIPFQAQGALLPALAPGEETACLIEVTRSAPLGEFDTLRLDQDPSFDVWLIDTSTGGRVYDPFTADNDTVLLAPAAPGGAVVHGAPTLSPFALALLAAGMLCVAVWAPRRRRSRATR